MAVAVGIFEQIILVVFFGGIEVFERLVFHHNGRGVFFLLARDGGGGDFLLGGVGGVDACAVLFAAVVALFVQAGGVDNAEVIAQDIVQAELVGIVAHFHGFGVPAVAVGYVFIAGVGGFAVGIARHGIGYARDALEIGFQAPEAAACQINGFDVHRFSFLRGIGFVEFFGIG